MISRTKSIVAAAGCVAVVGLASAFAFRTAQPDYSKLMPVDAGKVERKLAELGVSLADAVRKAEGETGGKALSAKLDLEADPPAVAVVVFADEAEHHVTINAKDMSVASVRTMPPYVLPGWAVDGEWTETRTGLRYWDVVEGEGAAADPTKRVTVHYTGYLVDGRKFDSSVDRGQPATFGLNQVIAGWTEGVGGMRVGGRRKLVIPYDLAYGAQGRPPMIPARAMLIFDVELIRIVD